MFINLRRLSLQLSALPAVVAVLLTINLVLVFNSAALSNIPKAQTGLTVSLVNTIDTSTWSPPAPDPGGIDYRADNDSLYISDPKADEFLSHNPDRKNTFHVTHDGNVPDTYTTINFSDEPTGIAIGYNGHMFFTDNVQKTGSRSRYRSRWHFRHSR